MRIHVVIRGRVQGVGFRWFVRERAKALDVAGWVKNRSDGRVEVAAEGAEHAMLQLRVALGEGPDGANVSSIEDLATTAELLARPFTIVR
jgi:acylphosphatase